MQNEWWAGILTGGLELPVPGASPGGSPILGSPAMSPQGSPTAGVPPSVEQVLAGMRAAQAGASAAQAEARAAAQRAAAAESELSRTRAEYAAQLTSMQAGLAGTRVQAEQSRQRWRPWSSM